MSFPLHKFKLVLANSETPFLKGCGSDTVLVPVFLSLLLSHVQGFIVRGVPASLGILLVSSHVDIKQRERQREL